ncbi:MAG: hypothetical protein IVW55_13025 [Chloroflexi bacterium]|nr:hypothetical protein [Chloroflexota bacterium]
MNKSRRRAVQKHRAKEHKFQALRKSGQDAGSAARPHATAPQSTMARPARPTAPTPAFPPHAESPTPEGTPIAPSE